MYQLDETDRKIINQLQGGFPVCEFPFQEVASRIDVEQQDLRHRIAKLIEANVLTRFGPMFQIERMGGAFSLAAIKVPEEDFARVTEVVNAFPEVAHNYRREHAFNMWFVLATETPEGIAQILERLQTACGYQVYNMPKEKEYFVGARFSA